MATKKTTTKKVTKKTSTKKTTKKAAPKKAATTPKAKEEFRAYCCKEDAFVTVAGAKEVEFEGFSDFRFFLHKTLGGGSGWTVSEYSTGAKINSGKTQKAAKEAAFEALKQVGVKEVAKQIKNRLEHNSKQFGKGLPEKKDRPIHEFEVTLEDGTPVKVKYDPEFNHHLEFKGEKISSTGYKSHFGWNGKGGMEKAAQRIAREFHAEFRKEATSKRGRKAATTSTPKATGGKGRAKGKMSILDAAVEILKEAQVPLCCKDITRQIFERKLAESKGRTPHATLSAAMGREISKLGKQARFIRVDRGTYTYNG